MGRLGSGFGGMMRGYGYTAPYAYTGAALNIAAAKTIAQNYVTSIGNPNLAVKQIEEYTNNFYVFSYRQDYRQWSIRTVNQQVHRQHLS